MRPTVVVLSAMLASSPQSANFAPIGSFSSVRTSNSEDPHCYGWSLKLWQFNGRLIGLLDRHEGLCGDPPCRALANVTHDARTGRLSFAAFDVKFEGTLRQNQITGTIGDERLALKRDDHRMDAPYDKDAGAWCDFWSAVPRCDGVTELCRSLRR